MSQYQIKIDEPCNENWNAMTPKEQGRFCGVCTKEVVDFTSMSDHEVKSYFTNYKGSLCGRFKTDQLEAKDERYFKLPDYTKKFIKALATVFLVISASCTSAQTMGEVAIQGDVVCHKTYKYSYKGIVYAQDGLGIDNAKIIFRKKGEKITEIVTNTKGEYAVRIEDGSYELEIIKHGYASLKTNIMINPGKDTYGDFGLEKAVMPAHRPIMGRTRMGKPAIKPVK